MEVSRLHIIYYPNHFHLGKSTMIFSIWYVGVYVCYFTYATYFNICFHRGKLWHVRSWNDIMFIFSKKFSLLKIMKWSNVPIFNFHHKMLYVEAWYFQIPFIDKDHNTMYFLLLLLSPIHSPRRVLDPPEEDDLALKTLEHPTNTRPHMVTIIPAQCTVRNFLFRKIFYIS